MQRRALRYGLLFLSALSAQAALAAPATCVQEKAAYNAASGGMVIAFQPVTEATAAISHRFTLTIGKTALDGIIMQTEEPVRSVARIMKDCPDGDVTGEDLRACTGFQGYVYAIAGDGKTGNLAGPGRMAAPRLLLAGLGPGLAYSPLAEKFGFGTALGDEFTFSECKS